MYARATAPPAAPPPRLGDRLRPASATVSARLRPSPPRRPPPPRLGERLRPAPASGARPSPPATISGARPSPPATISGARPSPPATVSGARPSPPRARLRGATASARDRLRGATVSAPRPPPGRDRLRPASATAPPAPPMMHAATMQYMQRNRTGDRRGGRGAPSGGAKTATGRKAPNPARSFTRAPYLADLNIIESLKSGRKRGK